jgi:hypothetical protein
LAAIIAGGVALVGGMALAPSASAQTHGEGLVPPGDWTHDQVMYMLDLIDETEQALPAYADLEYIQSLGFENFGATAPGGYDHWTNIGWINDEHVLDPAYPESLVFRHTSSGGYELQAAMFFLPSEYDLTNIPDDLAWLPGWHSHPELCVDENGKFTGLVDENGNCDYGSPADMPPMMHVWIVDNDCGHRFGGVGVGGLMCDVGSHDPHDPHDPPPTTAPPTTAPPTTVAPATTVPVVPPAGNPPPAPAARPVSRTPDYTG